MLYHHTKNEGKSIPDFSPPLLDTQFEYMNFKDSLEVCTDPDNTHTSLQCIS